jgi:hypothetical protein
MQFVYDDGGREAAGYKGKCGDCVVRAICIASGKPYIEVYNAIADGNAERKTRRRSRTAGKRTVRHGSVRAVYERYILGLGFRWVPCMKIGSGCKVHLHDGELPMGRLIVRLSGHLVAVIDGVIKDTHDPQRATVICEGGAQRIVRRCVYGYFIQEAVK